MNFALDVLNMEAAAAEEEAKDKSIKADFVKKQLRRRLEGDLVDGTKSAPSEVVMAEGTEEGDENVRSGPGEEEVMADDAGEGKEARGEESETSLRSRASES